MPVLLLRRLYHHSRQKKFCRQCGTECVPVQVQLRRPTAPKGFFARLPTAFIYPFRGSGLLMLLASTLVLALMEFLGQSWLFLFLKIIAYGYLFSFMQNIIHATANEEEQMPDLPGFDDVLGGAFRLAVTVLICFALPFTFMVLKFLGEFGRQGARCPGERHDRRQDWAVCISRWRFWPSL